jgi:poly(3-hydroxybutyrate) depolymerase
MTMTEANEALMSQLMKHLPTMESFGLHAGGAANATQLRETAQFGDDPGQLRMLSFVPENLGRSAPLVVALHGCTQTAAEYDRGTGWSNLADRYGFAVLLPEQRRGNNPNVCFDWFQPEDIKRGEGEVASIAAMVRNMVAEHGLDPKRVFVTGLSAGGAMTAALLATYPELAPAARMGRPGPRRRSPATRRAVSARRDLAGHGGSHGEPGQCGPVAAPMGRCARHRGSPGRRRRGGRRAAPRLAGCRGACGAGNLFGARPRPRGAGQPLSRRPRRALRPGGRLFLGKRHFLVLADRE